MFLISFFFLALPLSHPVDSYSLIGELLSKDQLPRILNSDDIQLNPHDPQPLFAPNGDFNGDGIDDMAISGIYTLPSGPMKYFLLVATQYENPVRYEKFLFKEFPKPVFIHKPKTTGERDPGNQAFSVTFCSNCNDGFDLYWDAPNNSFHFQPWEKRVRRYQQLPHAPELDLISPETVDQALKIVGRLKDVEAFVAGLKKKGGALGSRVNRLRPTDPLSVVEVSIFEKGKKREVIYDAITVDVEKETVLDRRRKIKKGK